MSGDRRDDRADRLLGYLPGELIGHADGTPGGVTAHLFEHNSANRPVLVPAVAEPLLVWIVAGSARIEEREDGGAWHAVEVGPGDLFIIDSDEPYELRWDVLKGPFRVLHAYLGVPLIETAAASIYGRAQRPRLREQSVCRPAEISSLLALIHAEIARPAPGSSFVVEAIARALAVAVLRLYADTDTPFSRRGVLPSNRLRRVVQHMSDHLPASFSLAFLAATVGMSPFHFGRMFKRSTGCSP